MLVYIYIYWFHFSARSSNNIMDYTAVEKMANLSGVFEPTEVIVFPFCTATWKQKFNFIHSNDLEVEFKRKRGIIVQ